MKSILIVGYGVVGKNLARELKKLNPFIKDKYKTEFNNYVENKVYDVAFICVDTPLNKNANCDITEVKNAINENKAKLYVIKSTILPNTTKKIAFDTGKHIVFSPEYYGGTQHCNNFDFNFTILGGNKADCTQIIQILQEVYDARHKFYMTDSTTAELVKYMENSWLATKVSFCNQFWNICKKNKLSYEELRELFILDPRVNPSHTFVYDNKPYWDSHCLNKDVPSIAEDQDCDLLKSVIAFNEKQKHKNDNK